MTTSKKKPPRKDPEGGLTAAGRAYFAKKEGAHLKPGVRGKTDTLEKKRRKGSFLRRHFANPRGPMRQPNGEPTRLALSAHAWGEPVPKTMADAKKLAALGTKLLDEYKRATAKAATKRATKKTAAKTVARKAVPKSSAKKATAARRSAKKRPRAAASAT